MKKLSSFFAILFLLLAGCSSPTARDNLDKTEKQKYQLYLDLYSEINLFFNTYDVVVELDDIEVGTIPNGKVFSKLIEVEEGNHTLKISNAGNSQKKATKTITVNSDMTFKCAIHHGGSIELKDIEVIDNIEGSSMSVPDLTGMILSDAVTKLKELGFDNIDYEGIGKSIWDKDNWLVQTQNISPNDQIDKHQAIVLTCIHLDDYFSEIFKGKTLAEVQVMEKNEWYSVKYEDDSWNDITSDILKMSLSEKEKWLVEKARQYTGDDNTALVTFKYINGTDDTAQSGTSEKGSNEEEIKQNDTSSMPVMVGTSLDSVISRASEYGVNKDYDEDFGHGTRGAAFSDASGGLMMDVIYSSSTKDILCAAIVTNKLASDESQRDFVRGMSSVLCPTADAENVSSWVNSNVGSPSETTINGFVYELRFGPVDNLLYSAGERNWEEWDLAQ